MSCITAIVCLSVTGFSSSSSLYSSFNLFLNHFVCCYVHQIGCIVRQRTWTVLRFYISGSHDGHILLQWSLLHFFISSLLFICFVVVATSGIPFLFPTAFSVFSFCLLAVRFVSSNLSISIEFCIEFYTIKKYYSYLCFQFQTICFFLSWKSFQWAPFYVSLSVTDYFSSVTKSLVSRSPCLTLSIR